MQRTFCAHAASLGGYVRDFFPRCSRPRFPMIGARLKELVAPGGKNVPVGASGYE
jgi:hypothetical protein